MLYDLVSGKDDDQTKIDLMSTYMESLGKNDSEYLLSSYSNNNTTRMNRTVYINNIKKQVCCKHMKRKTKNYKMNYNV